MRTPEEVKKALKACAFGCFHDCPYHDNPSNYDCQELLVADALALVEQLEEKIQLMLIQMKGDCGTCKHRMDERKVADKQLGCRLSPACYECLKKDGRSMWEYEGLPEL